MTRIAIIGAGVSGLTVANNLKNHAEITIFEKARSVGGRMSNRHAEPYFFDHRAQYFSVKRDEFKALREVEECHEFFAVFCRHSAALGYLGS